MVYAGSRDTVSSRAPKQRIGVLSAVTLVTLAFFLDGIQFFLTLIQGLMAGASLSVVGLPFLAFGGLAFVSAWAVSILSFLGFSLFFVASGVRFLEGRERLGKVFGLTGALAIELLPLLNVLPSITLWVLVTVYVTFKEDRMRLRDFKKQEYQRAPTAPSLQPTNDNEPRPAPEIPNNRNRAA